MKKLLTLLALTIVLAAQAQKETANWYFGYNAGVTFNNNPPTALIDSQMFTNEGSAVMSDANGNLLFYTDGSTVYNRTHSVMQNGTGLWGSFSSVQSALIVPKPGSDTIYYVFTVMNEGTGGLSYSVVDMQAANGLGAVITKNTNLLPGSTEQLTGVVHSNGTDIWVIAHGLDNNNIHSFLVTANGVNSTPVTTAIGHVIQGGIMAIGSLNVSPDGKKLVQGTYEMGCQLFDYNNTTGVVSNLIDLEDPQPLVVTMYMDFSPSGHVLYTNNIYAILQYDVTAPDVLATQTVVYEGIGNSSPLRALQVAMDGKIYFAQVSAPFLSVINNPEVLGTGCDIDLNAVYLEGLNSFIGLPTFVQSYFHTGITAQNFCLGSATAFTISPQAPQNVTWNFGDGQTSTEVAPQHTYATTGTYTVTATFIQNSATRVYEKTVTITNGPQFSLGGPYTVCAAQNAAITVTPDGFAASQAQYQWSFNGVLLESNGPSLQASDFGTYAVTVTYNGCSTTQSVAVTKDTTAFAVAIVTGCDNDMVTLAAQPDNGSFDPDTAVYAWTGPNGFTATAKAITTTAAGAYTVTITAVDGCTGTMVYTVANIDCSIPPEPVELIVPKGISPNNDGKNDELELSAFNIKKLSIFNRYGLEVYSLANYTNQWAGQTNNGHELPTGTYYYVVENADARKTGWIYINR